MSDKHNYNNPRIAQFTKFIRGEVNDCGGVGEFSKKTGISRPTINFWYNGERAPDAEKLVILSQKLNVSIDYMLTGVSADNREVSDITGLSDKSIYFLRFLNEGNINKENISFLNRVFEIYAERIKYDKDGDPIPVPTVFRDMEQYVCSDQSQGNYTFDDPNIKGIWSISELKRAALLKRIEKTLESLRKLERGKSDGISK